MNIKSIGRNDPCPCGSGKKYKQCCQNQLDNNNLAAKNRLLESIPDLFTKALSAVDKTDTDRAKELYAQILEINPKHIKSLHNLGTLEQSLGNHQKAIILFERALKYSPNTHSYTNLGLSLMALARDNDAIIAFKKALEINPSEAITHTNLGMLLCHNNNYKDGYYHLYKSLQINPNSHLTLTNLASILRKHGKYKLAQNYYEQSLKIKKHSLTYENYLFCLCFDEMAFPKHYLESAKQAEAYYINKCKTMYSDWPNTSNKNSHHLKIAFVSGDLRDHPVGYFIENIIKNINKTKFDLYAYSNSLLETELTSRIKPFFSQWLMIHNLNDHQLAQQIYNDKIDILIDLSGYTAHNRLGVFAHKPAPIQLSWLGYFASTGLSFIDYFIADPISVPIDKQSYFSEKVYYLPNTRLCFSPPHDEIATPNNLPSLHNGYITFGCFQNLGKINDKILTLWSEILEKTQGKLLIKNPQLDDTSIKLEFLAYLEKFNILEEQLILNGHSKRVDYFKSYHSVDFMLDTFPYPGGTTTCEALWMGVPTLTLTGNTLLERQGHSMLHNAGLGDWVCKTPEDYVQKAINFSKQTDYLANLRKNLRQQSIQSPLMDAKRFAHDLEYALFDIWQQRPI